MEFDRPADGEHMLVIEQGVEMGRPSLISLGLRRGGRRAAVGDDRRLGGADRRKGRSTCERARASSKSPSSTACSRRSHGLSRRPKRSGSPPIGARARRRSRASTTAACCCSAATSSRRAPTAPKSCAAPISRPTTPLFSPGAISVFPARRSATASRWRRCVGSRRRLPARRNGRPHRQRRRDLFPAGTPDMKDVFAGRVDLEASATRELIEETGVETREVAFGPGWTVVYAPPRIACMKIMRAAPPRPRRSRRASTRSSPRTPRLNCRACISCAARKTSTRSARRASSSIFSSSPSLRDWWDSRGVCARRGSSPAPAPRGRPNTAPRLRRFPS